MGSDRIVLMVAHILYCSARKANRRSGLSRMAGPLKQARDIVSWAPTPWPVCMEVSVDGNTPG